MKKTGLNYQDKDRRKRSDIWARMFVVFNVVSWVMIALILIVTERAKPEFESCFDRWYGLDIRTWWDLEFVNYLLWITMAGTLVSSIGLILGGIRARRRDDQSRFGIILMGMTSLIGTGGVVFFLL